jgi:hypothetical protein
MSDWKTDPQMIDDYITREDEPDDIQDVRTFKALVNEWIGSQSNRTKKLSLNTTIALHDFADWLDQREGNNGND